MIEARRLGSMSSGWQRHRSRSVVTDNWPWDLRLRETFSKRNASQNHHSDAMHGNMKYPRHNPRDHAQLENDRGMRS
jgi:hypothetical protein